MFGRLSFSSLLVLLCTITSGVGSAEAKARIIAVAPIRSTMAQSSLSSTIQAELIARLGSIDGYDAKPIVLGSGRAADAAAAIGATIYVAGQLIGDGSMPTVSITSFDVGTDHQIGSLSFGLVNGHLPPTLDVSTLAAPPQVGTASPLANTANAAILVLVPFEMPDNKDTELEFATTEFVKKMASKGKTLTQTPVIDHVEAATQVSALCKQFGASGVLIGTARHEQRLNYLLGSYPTHAEVRVTQLDCNGGVVWRGFGTGDLTYYFANAGAAVSDTIDKALDTVVSQYIDRQSTSPTAR